MKKVLAVFLAAAAMVGLTFGQLEAADKYTLRIGTSQTDQAFITRAYMTLADRLMEKSGGRLEVKVFPAGQLGGDEDILEQAAATKTFSSRLSRARPSRSTPTRAEPRPTSKRRAYL